ncbi:MAG TPA: histidine kinase dimerization/phosphoacceptor domain -containing protein, partial [Spirochaetota bacterium]|nr:histidine kinase dimerization/phosphoacceptor domain -containing protein [Spirochaetota bacterium]
MKLFSILSIYISALYFLIGLYSLYLNRKSKLNIVFFLNCFFMAFWSLCNAIYYTAPNEETANFWFQLSSVSWCIFPSLFLHFFLLLARTKCSQNIFFLIAIYSISAFLFIKNLTGRIIITGFNFYIDYWHPVIADKTPWPYIYYLYILSFLIIALVLNIKWFRKIKLHIEKRQSFVILIFFIFCLVFSIFTNIIFPITKIYYVPEIVPITSITTFIGIFIAIVKYRLMTDLVFVASDQIIAKSKEIFVFLDYEEKIALINDFSKELTKYDDKDVFYKKADFIFDLKENIDLHSLKDFKSNLITKQNEKIPVSISVSHIKDKKNNIFGTIIVGYDLRERLKLEKTLQNEKTLFQELYHRTKNNMQVISGLIELQLSKIGDNTIITKFRDINNKIYAMSLVHELLCLSGNLTYITSDIFISRLVDLSISNYGIDKSKIFVTLDIEKTEIIFDITIPLSIIISE